jgi:hypothetical protein
MNARSLFERRLIALGLLVLALTLAVFGVALPIAHGFADRADERARIADDLARGRQLIAARDYWLNEAQRQRADMGRFAVIAPDTSSAVQQVSDRLAAAIQTPGGALRSVREQPATPGEAQVRIEAQLTLTQLVASLKLIEGLKPFVVIETLSIAADPTAAAGRVPPMDVRIDLAVPYQVASG